MKKKIAMVIIGGIALAGCSMETPEMRANKSTDGSDLTFDKPIEKAAEKPAESKSVTKPPQPPVQPSNNVTGKTYMQAPAMTIDAKKQYTATLHTDAGNIVVELAAAATPITVNNFVFLAREKFYDGTIFHRTIPGFMIQGGDPQGTGIGGPGYKFADEPFTGQYSRGTVAMANSGANTNGSQFFIMHKDYSLPPNYVIFGHVVSGLEAVDKIADAPTKPGGEGSSPMTPVVVKTVDIVEK
jgi:cyclophilin family peptidyl-prolyl cis-trans isomerase